MEEGTSKSTEELAEDLLLLNEQLRKALKQDDPLPKHIGKKVLDQEAELQTQMEAAQEFLGSELGRSQKRAHAKRMYKKFEV